VIEVEKLVDLRQVAMEAARQLGLPNLRGAHLPVEFELRFGESRQRDQPLPAPRPMRLRDGFPVLNQAHQVSLDGVNGRVSASAWSEP
jgi:hypothetical protein